MSSSTPPDSTQLEPTSRSARKQYVCPRCRSSLRDEGNALRCVSCSRAYPVEHEIADFSEGQYYDDFTPGQQLSARETAGLAGEFAGAAARAGFYLEWLRCAVASMSAAPPAMRVLDCGCGNGVSVDLLNQAGVSAWGNDSSALRKWQWQDRQFRHRLLVCDARRLPFPDGFFGGIVCSGLLEHIGVVEQGEPRYKVQALPDRQQARNDLVRELLRILDRSGVLWLDFPNGAFPIDFWHAGQSGARLHSPREPFLPRVGDIRRYIRAIDPDANVRALSPEGRLMFKQVRRHWYGRVFGPVIERYFQLLSWPIARPLRGSFLNPYLVLEVRRAKPH